MVNDLINWADNNKKEDFKDFILFMNHIYEKKIIVNMTYINLKLDGKLNMWKVFYNKRFLDFDFDIKLDCYKNTITLSNLTMDNFKKVTNEKFVITDCNNNMCEFKTKEGI